MSIQRWSQDVVLVHLPAALTKHNGLQTVVAMLRDEGVCDVVVDFSYVQVVGGAGLAQLQKTQKMVNEGGHKLILCDVAPVTRGISTIAYIDDPFAFAENRFSALVSPRLVG